MAIAHFGVALRDAVGSRQAYPQRPPGQGAGLATLPTSFDSRLPAGQVALLFELDVQIQFQLDKEERFERMEEQIHQNPTVGLPNIIDRFFKRVDMMLKKYLTLRVLKMQRCQMSESLLYRTRKVENWKDILSEVFFFISTNKISSKNFSRYSTTSERS